jgi:nucleotide-binding universal stress UspA family protein
MYERILVTIDGGAIAAQGLREALKIASILSWVIVRRQIG